MSAIAIEVVQVNRAKKKKKSRDFVMQGENSEWPMARKLAKTVNDKVGPLCPKPI